MLSLPRPKGGEAKKPGKAMNRSKLKNIIILILLALNIFLLAAVITDKNQSGYVRQQAWQSAVSALNGVGVSVSDDVDGAIDAPRVYTLRRNTATERAMLERLLGRVSVEDLGGNIWYYSSAKGRASLRGSGETDMLLSSGVWNTGRDAARSVFRLMNKLGLPCDEESLIQDSQDEGKYTVNCAWKGGRVYNAPMTFYLSEDSVIMVTGTRVFDDVEQDSGDGVMDELSAMMRFYEIIIEEDWSCTGLKDLDVGYVQSVTVSDESTLTPVWRFSTDTGQLYINAVTGRIETLN